MAREDLHAPGRVNGCWMATLATALALQLWHALLRGPISWLVCRTIAWWIWIPGACAALGRAVPSHHRRQPGGMAVPRDSKAERRENEARRHKRMMAPWKGKPELKPRHNVAEPSGGTAPPRWARRAGKARPSARYRSWLTDSGAVPCLVHSAAKAIGCSPTTLMRACAQEKLYGLCGTIASGRLRGTDVEALNHVTISYFDRAVYVTSTEMEPDGSMRHATFHFCPQLHRPTTKAVRIYHAGDNVGSVPLHYYYRPSQEKTVWASEWSAPRHGHQWPLVGAQPGRQGVQPKATPAGSSPPPSPSVGSSPSSSPPRPPTPSRMTLEERRDALEAVDRDLQRCGCELARCVAGEAFMGIQANSAAATRAEGRRVLELEIRELNDRRSQIHAAQAAPERPPQRGMWTATARRTTSAATSQPYSLTPPPAAAPSAPHGGTTVPVADRASLLTGLMRTAGITRPTELPKISSFNYRELQGLCRAAGVPATGSATALAKRLRGFLTGSTGSTVSSAQGSPASATGSHSSSGAGGATGRASYAAMAARPPPPSSLPPPSTTSSSSSTGEGRASYAAMAARPPPTFPPPPLPLPLPPAALARPHRGKERERRARTGQSAAPPIATATTPTR